MFEAYAVCLCPSRRHALVLGMDWPRFGSVDVLHADVAQGLERFLAKEEVAGSRPAIRSDWLGPRPVQAPRGG
jgi:hypothetical protein